MGGFGGFGWVGGRVWGVGWVGGLGGVGWVGGRVWGGWMGRWEGLGGLDG